VISAQLGTAQLALVQLGVFEETAGGGGGGSGTLLLLLAGDMTGGFDSPDCSGGFES
jgi:hypothetical protein